MNYRRFLSKVWCIIPAGGAGFTRKGRPKVTDLLPTGLSILGQLVTTVIQVGIQKIVIVVNDYNFQGMVQQQLAAEDLLDKIQLAFQPARTGAGEAVRIGLEEVPSSDCHSVVVVFGDMPCLQTSTLKGLLNWHYQNNYPDLSMLGVQLEETTPQELESYGRIQWEGDLSKSERLSILDIYEPGDPRLNGNGIGTGPTIVSPTVFVIRRAGLIELIKRIPFIARHDGHGDERYLPPLTGVIHRSGGRISLLPLPAEDHWQVLGVNDCEQLERVRDLFRRHVL